MTPIALLMAIATGVLAAAPRWDTPQRPEEDHLLRSIVGVADDEASILKWMSDTFPKVERRDGPHGVHEYAVDKRDLEEIVDYLHGALSVRDEQSRILSPFLLYSTDSRFLGVPIEKSPATLKALRAESARAGPALNALPLTTALLASELPRVELAARIDRYWRHGVTLRIRLVAPDDSNAKDVDDLTGFANRWDITAATAATRLPFNVCRALPCLQGGAFAADSDRTVAILHAAAAAVGGVPDTDCPSGTPTTMEYLIPIASLERFKSTASKRADIVDWTPTVIDVRSKAQLDRRDGLAAERASSVLDWKEYPVLASLVDSEIDRLRPLAVRRDQMREWSPVSLVIVSGGPQTIGR